MDSVLIVSSTDKGKTLLVDLLKNQTFSQVTTVDLGSEARRLFIENSFDLVIINAPLADEFGHELAQMITESTMTGVIMIVKSELADEISAKVEEFGVFVVPKPVSRQMFFQSLKLVEASRRRIIGLRNENLKLQKKIEEIRLVDRAKCALIQYLNFTEPQAHRHIEKQAMDMRVTKREIAEGILKIYEN